MDVLVLAAIWYLDGGSSHTKKCSNSSCPLGDLIPSQHPVLALRLSVTSLFLLPKTKACEACVEEGGKH